MMLMLLASTLATVQYKQMNDECQNKCNQVTTVNVVEKNNNL